MSYENQCGRKKVYRSRKAAMECVKRMTTIGVANRVSSTVRLGCYECPRCGGWHVGHELRKAVQ